MNVFTFLGFLYQVSLWVGEAEEKRKVRAEELKDGLEEPEGRASIRLMTSERANKLEVKFDKAWTTITDDLTSRLNGELNKIDFNNNHRVDDIVSNLRETAKIEAKHSLEKYVHAKIGDKLLKLLEPWHELPSYQGIKHKAITEYINKHVEPKLRDLENDPSGSTYDHLTRSLTLEARERAFVEKYDAVDKESSAAAKAYNDARKQRETTQKDIKDLTDKINTETKIEEIEKEEIRRKELVEALEKMKIEEDEKNKAKEQAEEERKEAADKSKEAKDDVKKDDSRAKWDEKGKHIFK